MSDSNRAPAQTTAGICRDGNRYLLGRRVSGGAIGGLWEFPGGKVRPGESARAALERELYEELGVTVEVGRFIGSVEFAHRERRYEALVFEASLHSTDFRLTMHSELRWYTLAQLMELDLPGSDRQIAELLVRSSE